MKTLKLSLALLLALNLAACVVDDEEYNAAQRQRDDYRAQLQEMYQVNDQLNQEIAGIYAECEILSDKLALVAASQIQAEYATDLVNSRPRTRPRGTY